MGLSIVTAEEIDSPFVDLQAKEPEIERFSASTLIFLFDLREPPTAYVLLCQRALLGKDENGHDKVNSWALSWEPPGGSQELFGKIILSTAQRETEEEAKLHGLRVSHQVYRDSWIDKGVLMVNRTWCDRQQQPIGTDKWPIRLREDEHLDYCWATEAQIPDSPSYDGKDPRHQRGLVMLESKKDVILDAFMRLKNSQLDMTYDL